MILFIKKTILFLFLFIASNFIYLIILQKTDWNYKKRIDALTLDAPDNDIIVIGNSLAMDGIDTELLSQNGYQSYNLSLGGSSLRTNYIQLNEYLTLYEKKPKCVILGLGSYLNDFEKETIHPIVEYTQKDREVSFRDLPMLKFRWLFKELLKKLVSKAHREASLKYGQLRFKKQVPDNTALDHNNDFPIDRYKSAPFIYDIIDLCSDYDIELIIVEMPGLKKTRHKKRFNCMLLDEVNNNGLLLDYNNFSDCEIFDDQKDWIGDSHLNAYGAKKMTTRLLSDLQKMDVTAPQRLKCR